MAKVSLERLSKTFIETAKSHGISVSQAKEAFEEAKRDMDRRKDEKRLSVQGFSYDGDSEIGEWFS